MVEGTGLENRQGCKSLVGSNPTPSANRGCIRKSRKRASHKRPAAQITRPMMCTLSLATIDDS